MKSKLNYLIKTSLARKLKSKWFKVANILLAIIIIGVAQVGGQSKGGGITLES